MKPYWDICSHSVADGHGQWQDAGVSIVRQGHAFETNADNESRALLRIQAELDHCSQKQVPTTSSSYMNDR